MKTYLIAGMVGCLFASYALAQSTSERPEYADPPSVQSKNGVLSMELTVAPTKIEVGGDVSTERNLLRLSR